MEVVNRLLDDVQNLSGASTGGDRALISKLSQNVLSDFLDRFHDRLLSSSENNLWDQHSWSRELVEAGYNPSFQHFLKNLLSRIFDYRTGNVLTFPDAEAFRLLYQVSSLLKKFGSGEITEEMKTKALSQYVSDEERVASLDLSGEDELLDIARDLIERYILRFVFGEPQPRHGPGAVAEGSMPFWEKYRFNPHEDLDVYWPQIRLHRNASSNFAAEPEKSRISRLCFVPKSRKKCRIICAEPSLLQYLQQGERGRLYRAIEISNLDLDLRDQSRNAQLALESSDHGYYATIDLRSASDLLSLDLVGALFPTPMFARFAACRSHFTCVQRDGRPMIIPLTKFGSMGNALTFPVQSIVFWGLVASTLILSGLREREATTNVWVYGDDIICPSQYIRGVFQKLEACGLSPNQEKSFWKGAFRESCGIHAFNGRNVTPIYLRTLNSDPEGLVSTCASARGLQSLGYASCSEWLYGHIERNARIRLPFSQRADGLARWFSPDFPISECIQLNLQKGIKVKRNRYQYPVVATKGIRPERLDMAEFDSAWDMWDYVGPTGNHSDRDRGSIARGKRLAYLDLPVGL